MTQNEVKEAERSGRRHGLGVATRTVEVNAGFLIPHLEPGMSLLDVGCGPGSITLGLAAAVGPGEVVGIDISKGEVEKAGALAAERNVPNVHFEVGDVLHLPFADGTFDAAFSHSVLMHLADPLAAAKEVCRVLKPGGVYGISDRMLNFVMGEQTPAVMRYFDIYFEWSKHRGVDLNLGAKLRPLLRKAGFGSIEVSAQYNGMYGTPERAREFAQSHIEMAHKSTMMQFALDERLATPTEMEETLAALDAWGEDPDSFVFLSRGQGIGWKPT